MNFLDRSNCKFTARQLRYLAIEFSWSIVAIASFGSVANSAEDRFFRCNFYYRSNVAGSTFKPIQKSIDLIPNRQEKFTINEVTISLGYVNFDPHESSSMGVSVGMKNSKKAISSVGYQFMSIAEVDRNVGNFGFTGLHFFYIPNSDRELQYWCKIESKKADSKKDASF